MSRKDERKKKDAGKRQRILTYVCAALIALVVLLSAYIAFSLRESQRAQEQGEAYRELYYASPQAPTETPPASPEMSASPSPTPLPTATPAPSPTPTEMPSGIMVEIDGRTIVLGTPDAGTIRVALPTLPPVDASFEPLLAENADIVGWLKVSDIIDLPVAQRDNEYYLSHGLDGEELSSGALFMDEANKLFPLDGNTLIYGHNMHDGSMFGRLSRYANARYLRENPIVEFATLYETGEYVPFAAFHASMEAEDEEYFEIRQLAFAMEDSFDLFIEQLRARSVYYVPIDVRYGDELLSLVTCSYEQDNGRFILVCRKIREGESREDVMEKVKETRIHR